MTENQKIFIGIATGLVVAVSISMTIFAKATETYTIVEAPQTAVVTAPIDKNLYGCDKMTATAEELEEAAKLVYLEAGGESADCQRAIAEVIFNRVKSEFFPNNLHEVIHQTDGKYLQFSPSGKIPYTTTTDEIRQIVNDVFYLGNTITSNDVLFFRSNHYHRWCGAIDVFEMENVYFSASVWCK